MSPKSDTGHHTQHSTSPIPHLNEKLLQDMDIEQFSETISSIYLPFTLRKMYYKELMQRKPIFLGASKKGVGFEPPTSPHHILNERTCQAQN